MIIFLFLQGVAGWLRPLSECHNISSLFPALKLTMERQRILLLVVGVAIAFFFGRLKQSNKVLPLHQSWWDALRLLGDVLLSCVAFTRFE